MPRPEITFSYGENDNKMIEHGVERANQILKARKGKPAFVVADTGHLLGGCRMGSDPKNSVVNSSCQSHDIPNLFISDASIFTTSAGVNPTETVMAIAARTAEHIETMAKKGDIT